MENTIRELRQIIQEYSSKISIIGEADFAAKPLPNKWSKKEVLGHLVDSAHNNLRRFICGQYEETPPKIVYSQDFWVSTNGYQNMKKEDVIQFWRLINNQICTVLEKMPQQNYSKQVVTGEPKTLQWLAEDYLKHMKHHMNQIIPGSFDIVYKS
jgi:hypothetical protein